MVPSSFSSFTSVKLLVHVQLGQHPVNSIELLLAYFIVDALVALADVIVVFVLHDGFVATVSD